MVIVVVVLLLLKLTPAFFDIQILIPRASAFMALAFCKAASASILAQLPRCTFLVWLPSRQVAIQ